MNSFKKYKVTLPSGRVCELYFNHKVIDIKGEIVAMTYEEYERYIRKLKIEKLELL